MIVFGGETATGRVGETWALALDRMEWTLLAPSGAGPEARRDHSAIYDSVGGRMIVFGGTDPSPRNDLWGLSLTGAATWAEIPIADPKPSARSTHTAVYDGMVGQMIVFGGYGIDRAATTYLDDLWALSLSSAQPTWAAWNLSGSAPGHRAKHVSVYDPVGVQLVVFGGTDGAGKFGDPWLLPMPVTSETRWVQGVTPYTSKFGGAAVYDPKEKRMIAYGGFDYDGKLNPTLMLMYFPARGGSDWKFRTAQGPQPPARTAHTIVYAEDKAIVFGGLDATSRPLDDVWSLALPSCP
jgi:hypothetical protein